MTTTRSDSGIDQTEELHARLQEALAGLVTSEDWLRALKTAALFHNYSFSNTMLIWSQAAARGFTPEAVAGYRKWQQLGRQVRRGEHGLKILAPVTRRLRDDSEPQAEEPRRVVGFRVVHVFDISQTDGDPLPDMSPEPLKGAVPNDWQWVASAIEADGFTLTDGTSAGLGQANGTTNWSTRRVTIKDDLPGAQRFKTAVHELAHIRLHAPDSSDRPACRGTVEVEAESVAHIVCAQAGIDTSSYSLPYVAAWSGGDLDIVTDTANRVIACSRDMSAELLVARELAATTVTGSPRNITEPNQVDQGLSRVARLGKVVAAAASLYSQQLTSDNGNRALQALRRRGMADDTIEQWTLGYAPAHTDTVTRALATAGFTTDDLIDAGVALRSTSGQPYDRFRDRIMFPIHDQTRRPCGFAGRRLGPDGPKYLNTPETQLYRKSELLYGHHHATEAIRRQSSAIVVEGYADAIAAHQAGFTNTVAVAGTALSPAHIAVLGEIAASLTIAFDGDDPGLQAAHAVATRHGIDRIDLRIAIMPAGYDPEDLITHNANDFARVIDKAQPARLFAIDRIVTSTNLDEPEAIAKAIHTAAPLVAAAPDLDARSQATAFLADRLGRSTSTIERQIAASLHVRNTPHTLLR